MLHTENKTFSPSSRSAASIVAVNGMLLCTALVFSYIESMIPLNFIVPIPGLKLGFANIAVMAAVVWTGAAGAGAVAFLRVLVSSFLFGSVTSFWFSLSGTALSFAALLAMKKSGYAKSKLSWIGVSVICAAAHNTGQIAAAAVIFESASVFSYIPYLYIMAVICGIITGSVMCLVSANKTLSKHLKKYLSVCIAATVPAILFSGCGLSEEYRDVQMFYMDTVIDIRFSEDKNLTDEKYAEIEKKCGEIIENIEKKISRTIEGSYISDINKKSEEEIKVEYTVLELIKRAFHISEITYGAYDPTLGYLTDLWNISGGGEKIPEDAEISEALTHTGKEKFKILSNSIYKDDTEARIDLGGIGKGYAADKVIEYLYSAGLSYGLISMGGNVGVFGEKPDGETFRIGIRDPDDFFGVAGYLNIKSGFVAVSGDYERYIEADGKRYHHIFDPETGYPCGSGLRSVAVWCENGAYGDALSTALFVMGCERAIDFYNSGESEIDFEAVFITSSNEIIVTGGLKDSSVFEISGDKYTPAYN